MLGGLSETEISSIHQFRTWAEAQKERDAVRGRPKFAGRVDRDRN